MNDVRKDLAGGNREADTHDRWRLANSHDLADDVYETLYEGGGISVIAALAGNGAIPRTLVARIVADAESLLRLARFNPRAPADIKDHAPIGNHNSFSLDIYLAERGATIEESREVHRIAQASAAQEAPLLGEVWRAIRSRSADGGASVGGSASLETNERILGRLD